MIGNRSYNQIIEAYLIAQQILESEKKQFENAKPSAPSIDLIDSPQPKKETDSPQVNKEMISEQQQLENNQIVEIKEENESQQSDNENKKSDNEEKKPDNEEKKLDNEEKKPDQSEQKNEEKKLSPEEKKRILEEGQIISDFLEQNASQLTVYGLSKLYEGLNNGQLAVFFRNNHFSTLCKYNDYIFLLVTDEGYAGEKDIVWERISEVEGDSVFCRGDFSIFVHPKQKPRENTENDYKLALELQKQEGQLDQQPVQQQDQTTFVRIPKREKKKPKIYRNPQEKYRDEALRNKQLAMEREKRQALLAQQRAQQQAQQHAQQKPRRPSQKKSQDDLCVIS